MHSVGFEWEIAGDDNRNAIVQLEYREKGTYNWKRGLDLLRTENNYYPSLGTSTGNKLAGSAILLEDGISAQPSYAGPTYIFRNEIINARDKSLSFKFFADAFSSEWQCTNGLYVLHNSVVNSQEGLIGSYWSNTIFRNNLIYGADG